MIKFGPSGNSESFYHEGYKHTEEASLWLKNKGLDLFEYSFGRGVIMSSEKANSINSAFKENGIEISVHAPYFINFANVDEEMVEKSYNYVLQSAIKCREMGGKRIVFHPATQGKLPREEAVILTKKRLKILAELITLNGFDDMLFCPETMGKSAQIGTVEEVTEFCKIAPFYIPTIDFGHVNAREQGSLK
ncbi:MAG: TIM barrel protein, partial [Clostridia bacterium]|nr:TIM barrel protein [Clostridia bacterium]